MKLRSMILPALLGIPVVAALPMLAGCGSESNDPIVRDPFIIFSVNGVISPQSITVKRVYIDGVDSNSKPLYYPCNPDLFANAGAVEIAAPDFCVTETTTANVVFSVQFVNNSLVPLGLQYQGLGYSVQIFEYDATATDSVGVEVWNSNYAEQQRREVLRAGGNDLGDFDPSEEHFIELGAAESFPSQAAGAQVVTFVGRGNIKDGYADAAYSVDGLFVRPTDGGGDPLCDWAAIETDSGTSPYERVLCQGEELLPLPSANDSSPIQYWVRVRFNFNDWQSQPDDVLLTVDPVD